MFFRFKFICIKKIQIDISNISKLTITKYMKELGLRSKLARRYRITTDSEHNYLVVDNILDRQFTQTEPGKAWVSDITYIAVKEGGYLSNYIQ